ncbi:flagellar export protein FliJ [Deferribacter abyssi]|uniref:flagellar export protein FliJ n=1 Tax=Deferribacter abyssi TaxID=213806 RepID=UPI003C158C84
MKSAFPLQKVLEHRKRIYEIKLQELERLRSELSNLENERKLLVAEYERLNQEIMSLDNEMILMKPLYDKYKDRVKKAIENVEDRIAKKRIEIEGKKKEVVDALNDKKIMEKLKEKHIIDYREFLKKEELKLIDELVITRFNR